MSTRNEKAVEFLKSLDINTTAVGGFNRAATYEAFKGLSDLYEEIIAETTADLKKELDEKGKLLDEQSSLAAEKTEQIDKLTKQVATLQSESDRMRTNMEEMIDRLRTSAEEEKRAIQEDADRRVGIAKAEAESARATAQRSAVPTSIAAQKSVARDDGADAGYVPAARSVRSGYQAQQSPEQSWSKYRTMLESEVIRARQEMEDLRQQTEMELQQYRTEAEEHLACVKSEREGIIRELRQLRSSLDQTLGAVGTTTDRM